jgi:putative intracellular protease/amidase
MKHKSCILSLWILAIATAVIAEDGKMPALRVALFDDDGSFGKGVPTVTAQLGKAAGITVTMLKGAQIGDGTLANDAFDVVIFTGGSGSKQSKAIGESGLAQVKSFVEKGGGYIGICAGAYLACDGFSWGAKILDAKTVSSKWKRGKGDVKIEPTDKGREILGFPSGQLDVRYANGPIYKNDSPKGAMVNSPAMVAGTFGKGRVICSSPHPEQTAGMESFIVRAVRWTAGK